MWMYVWDIEDEASPCWKVVSGLSWGSLVWSITIQELASQDTAEEESDPWSVLTESFQSVLLLLLASAVATEGVEVRGSADRLTVSSDLLLVPGKGCVCSVSVEKKKISISLSHCSLQRRH